LDTSILELYHHGRSKITMRPTKKWARFIFLNCIIIEDQRSPWDQPRREHNLYSWIVSSWKIKDHHETNQEGSMIYILELYHHGRSKITMRPTKKSCDYGSMTYFWWGKHDLISLVYDTGWIWTLFYLHPWFVSTWESRSTCDRTKGRF
jgi:hypothetical protein